MHRIFTELELKSVFLHRNMKHSSVMKTLLKTGFGFLYIKRHRKVCISVLVLALLTCTIHAQQVMTLERCRALALENNKAIAIATLNKVKAEYTQKAYRTNYLPKLSATGNYFYSNVVMHKTISGNYLPTFVPDPATGQLAPNILVMMPDGSPVFKEYAYFPDMDISLKLSGTWMVGLSAEQPFYTGGKITTAYKMAQIGSEITDLNQAMAYAEMILQTDEAYFYFER